MMNRSSTPACIASAGLIVGLFAMPLSATPSLAAPQASWNQGAKFTATRSTEVDHVADKAVDVSTDNGEVKITKGGTDKVQVNAKVRATTQERLDATKVVASRGADGTLTIRVQWPNNKQNNNEGCDIEVVVPGATNVTAKTDNGSITVHGLNGAANLGTSNGSITVDSWTGDVNATTSNGSIEVTGVSGKIDASSSNGRVRAKDVQGPVRTKTSNASVEVSLKPTSTGPVDIQTDNGSVQLHVGPAFVGKLHAQTSNGKVSVHPSQAKPVGKPTRDEGTWQFGEGGAASEVETDNGSITVEVIKSGQ